MTSERTDYRAEAESDAKTMFQEFVGQMCAQWEQYRKVSDDFNNDYAGGDDYHHGTHVDKEYDLTEAAAVLDQLSDYEETDYGLWQGLEPRRAIAAQAAYTYGNAVASCWHDIISDVNDDLATLTNIISDAHTDDADDDARQAELTTAGQRYLRLYAALIEAERRDYDGMAGAALDAAGAGDWTAALALADWLQERGHDWKAEAIRAAVK